MKLGSKHAPPWLLAVGLQESYRFQVHACICDVTPNTAFCRWLGGSRTQSIPTTGHREPHTVNMPHPTLHSETKSCSRAPTNFKTSEIHQTQKDTYCMLLYIGGTEKWQILRDRKNCVCPGGAVVKNPLDNAGNTEMRVLPESRRSPGVGNSNPLQYPCLEKSHGQRSLADYKPWDCTTEPTHTPDTDILL